MSNGDATCSFHGCDMDMNLQCPQCGLEDKIEKSRKVIRHLLERHVRLVESGDCGFWDVETEEAVISARSFLAGTNEYV